MCYIILQCRSSKDLHSVDWREPCNSKYAKALVTVVLLLMIAHAKHVQMLQDSDVRVAPRLLWVQNRWPCHLTQAGPGTLTGTTLYRNF